MKVDIRNKEKFEVKINRSFETNQYVLTIDSGNKVTDITFESYDELRKVYDVISSELEKDYRFYEMKCEYTISDHNNVYVDSTGSPYIINKGGVNISNKI